jgi:hypothetical protein
MVCPIVAPPDLQGPWCEQFWIYIILESFHVNMTHSGSVVLEKKIFKWTHPFLLFCDYLPFEEDLALYSNNLESPLPKDDLCQVWLKLACWFWRRFFSIYICKMVFPIVAPPDPLGPWCEQFWIYIISESFHVNMTYSGFVVLDKKIFKLPHPIFAFL